MSDEELRHLCKLATIYVAVLESEDIDHLREMDDREWRDARTCLQIVGKAFVELCRRQGMQPTFRISAGGSHD